MAKESVFCSNLKYLRQSQSPHLSKSRLASIVGLDRRTYSDYERGVHEAPHWFAAKIAGYFAVSLDDLTNKDLERSGFSADKTSTPARNYKG